MTTQFMNYSAPNCFHGLCKNMIINSTIYIRCIPRWHPLRRGYQLRETPNTWPTVSLREFEGTDVTLKNILHRYRLTHPYFTTESLELCAR